jgi:hypothetical protein
MWLFSGSEIHFASGYNIKVEPNQVPLGSRYFDGLSAKVASLKLGFLIVLSPQKWWIGSFCGDILRHNAKSSIIQVA